MLRIQATIGANTYYFASEALDYADRYWEPRISNAFQISREFNSADKTGNKIRSVDVSLDNRDGFFNSIYTADGLVNGKFVLYFNEGDNNVKTFTGRVNKINSFGDDVSLTIREVGYEYLTRKFPDAQIAYDYYSTSGINESWNAIPIHLGTVNRYPCPWVNLFYSHFIIGSGPIHAVKKIYFDKTVVYDSSTGQNGYKPTPDSPEIKFRVFKGARAGQIDIVDGITSSYPGFAYIQLYKIVDAVEQPADPINPDGEAVQIYVDIEGLQNEAGNGAERNPAQILYQFFTKPYTAEEGYGLAISPDDLDFSAAITECGIQGFKIDGSIDNTTDFGEWIDEILRCCRGQLYETGGKISVRIDAAAASPTIHFDETGELGYNCIVDTWNEPERDAQTNRVRLSYSWNFENNNFNKKPSYNQESPIGDTNLQNPTHAARIQKWNTETLEYKLIKDDTTAHKLAQYYLNNIVKQLITTSLTTEVDIPNTVDAGTVVKVTSPKFGWSEKLFRITSISRAEENTEIQLKEYDASIFTFTDPGNVAETSGSQYSVYNIPAKPELTSLSIVNELLADGSTQTRINVNFVAPTENAQLVALYYKPAGGTEADFKPLDTALSSAGTMSVIWKGIESGNYNFRLVTISPVGIYSDLSIVSGDKHYYWGQPDIVIPTTETDLVITGDTVAPGKPLITDCLAVQCGVRLSFDIPTGFPSDFSHFAVYRKLDGGSLLPLDMKYTGRLFTDTDVAGYVSRQYSIVAYDESNNPSESSDLTIAVTPLKIHDIDTLRKLTPADALNTDPYFADWSAWAGDLEGAASNQSNFVTITDGVAGSTAFKSTAGQKIIFGVHMDSLIPYDSTRHYILFAYMRATGGTHGLGFAFYNADKALLAQWSIETAAVDTNLSWQRFSKAFTSVPTGTAFISPMIICNNDETAGVVLDVQKCQLREVITSDILIANEAVITNAIQILNAIITNAHIVDLDAIKIKSGTIDVGRLAASIAHVGQLAVLGRNLLQDPSFLEVPKGFSNGTITINGDLENVFIGESFDFGGWSIIADESQALFGVWTSESALVPIGNGIHLILDLDSASRAYIGQRVKIMPLQHYSFSTYIAILETAANVDLVIAWYNGETYLSKTSARVQGDLDDLQRVYVTGQAPTGATHAIVYIHIETMPGTGYRHAIVSALQFEYGEEPTAWVGREQGTITAERIFTGLLKSLNYEPPLEDGDFAEAGTLHDLNNGTIVSKSLVLDEDGNLKIRGDITGSSGNFTGDITGATGEFSGVVGSGPTKFNSSSILVNCVSPVDQNVYIKIGEYAHGIVDVGAARLSRLRILVGTDILDIFGSCFVTINGTGWDFAQVSRVLKRSDKSYTIYFYKNTSDNHLYIRIYSASGFPVTQGGTLTMGSTIKIVESVHSIDEMSVSAPAGTLVSQYALSDASADEWHSGSSFYRKQPDGWIEQGGIAAGGSVSVTFPVEFADTNYNLQLSLANPTGGAYCSSVVETGRTAAGFTTAAGWSTPTQHGASGGNVNWIARGFVNA